jgi:hypothetical protein
VLAWLLGEPESETVRATLAGATEILTSDLTLVECDRALIRAQAILDLRASEVARGRHVFETTAAHWVLLRMSPAIVERARRPFPGDPIRSLDALHLASALAAAEASDDLAVLSLDRRVRGSAQALGLSVVPARIPK